MLDAVFDRCANTPVNEVMVELGKFVTEPELSVLATAISEGKRPNII